MTGRLEIIIGCMFSGKSSEMIRRLKCQRAIGKKVLVINSTKDIRSVDDVIRTHDGTTFDCIKSVNLFGAMYSGKFEAADVVAIDECQFFKGIGAFVEHALKLGKHVILAGLDGDYQQNIFGELLWLIPLADNVTKLTALCMTCADGQTPGPFTKRICDSMEQELVGAEESYKAVCRKHL